MSLAIHVWTVWLTASDPIQETYRSLLAAEERERANRFITQPLRRKWEISRGALRLLLSQYSNVPPAELAFQYGRNGKPELTGELVVHFNMSHSENLAIFAITRECELGVDIEVLRAIPDLENIASKFFCYEEILELHSIADKIIRDEVFLRCWTRKESYVKALGLGLSIPLNKFRVSLLPSQPAHFVHLGDDERKASTWSLHHLDPVSGYIGALAYRGSARPIILHPTVSPDQLLFMLRPGIDVLSTNELSEIWRTGYPGTI